MSNEERSSPSTAPKIFALFCLTEFLLLVAVHVAWQSGPFPTQNFRVGYDFDIYFKSAGMWLGHLSPYANRGFPAPPASLITYLLLRWLPVRTAHWVFFWGMLATLSFGMWKFCRRVQLSKENTALAFVVMFTFAPLWAALHGGNIDCLMLLLLLAASLVKREWLRNALVGISVATKAYSALIPFQWLIQRRWKKVVGALIGAAVITLPFAPYLSDMIHRLLWRTTAEFANDNISPGSAFQTVFGHNLVATLLYLFYWGGTLTVLLYYGSHRRAQHDPFEDWKLVAWMMGFPALVLSYVAVLSLPLIVLIFKRSESRRFSTWDWVSLAGLATINFYPLAFARLLPLTDEAMHLCLVLFNPINAFGTTLLLMGIAMQTRRDAKDSAPGARLTFQHLQ